MTVAHDNWDMRRPVGQSLDTEQDTAERRQAGDTDSACASWPAGLWIVPAFVVGLGIWGAVGYALWTWLF